MASYNLALILKKDTQNDDGFLLIKQTPPPRFNDEEYDAYVDSDLWDLPFTKLNVNEGEKSEPTISIQVSDSCSESNKINLSDFDIESALIQILGQVGFGVRDVGEWRLWKCEEEAEFGPGFPVHTVYIMGTLLDGIHNLQEGCKWMSAQSCLDLLVEVKLSSDRVGPLVVVGLLNDLLQSRGWKVPPTLHYQEYPPGVILVPMQSRTAKPFLTTNLVVFAPESASDEGGNYKFVAHGEALIVDPGCKHQFHEELLNVVASLPRKLIVFVTHHHPDHVDGLSVIQKRNPDAILLAHENTMSRIRKDDWSLGCTSVSGGEDICVGGQRLTVVFAPGHTDGHAGLLHVSTNSLIVGDHCGNAILQASLERRKQALHERRLALEQDVSRLQEQLQAERDLRAALEVGLSMSSGQFSSSRGMDSKTRAELEEIALAEADVARLKQKVAELHHQLNQQRQHHYGSLTDACDRYQNVQNHNSQQRFLPQDFDTTLAFCNHERKQRTEENLLGADWRNIKGQGLATGSSSRLPSRKQYIDSNSLSDSKSTEASTNMSVDELIGVDSASVPSTSRAVEAMDFARHPSAASSALVELTSRLDFFKERRSQLMEQLHNLDLNYGTTSSQDFIYRPSSPPWN